MTRNERDEMIIAKILSGAPAVGRTICQGSWGVAPGDLPDGPCCAIGSGLLFAGVKRVRDNRFASVNAFARHYGVSKEYAQAVSDGFEACGSEWCCKPYNSSADSLRGWSVGRAVAEAVK